MANRTGRRIYIGTQHGQYRVYPPITSKLVETKRVFFKKRNRLLKNAVFHALKDMLGDQNGDVQEHHDWSYWADPFLDHNNTL